MGQRSQIYVKYNGKLIIANYYQWNYGERMISRVRYTMERFANYIANDWHKWALEDEREIEIFRRFFDVNFNYYDIVMSQNILEGYERDKNEPWCLPKEQYVYFRQDNNDGKFLLDISKDGQMKYAFLDWEANTDNIMTAWQYAQWDIGDNLKENSDYFDDESRAILIDNVREIAKMAPLMTKDEVSTFLSTV